MIATMTNVPTGICRREAAHWAQIRVASELGTASVVIALTISGQLGSKGIPTNGAMSGVSPISALRLALGDE